MKEGKESSLLRECGGRDYFIPSPSFLSVKTHLPGKQMLEGQELDLPPIVLGSYGTDASKKTVLVYGKYDCQKTVYLASFFISFPPPKATMTCSLHSCLTGKAGIKVITICL